jgi:hypothetical protein
VRDALGRQLGRVELAVQDLIRGVVVQVLSRARNPYELPAMLVTMRADLDRKRVTKA